MIRILVDSTSDLSAEELKQNNYSIVPLKVNINNHEYLDGITLQKDEFYEQLISSGVFPKTSQPSPQAFLDIFEDVKEKKDELICILLSSNLSGTCQSAQLAKEIVDYEKIYIVDSLSASYGVKILMQEAHKMIQERKKAEEIVASLNELKKRITIYASVDTLEYLYRGGRLDKASYVIGGLAKIKPVIYVTKEGKIDVLTKVIGISKVMKVMLEHVLEDEVDSNYPLYTAYTLGKNNLEKFESKLMNLNLQISDQVQIGPAIGSHIGPEAFGIIFIRKNEI
ncbi:MAG: DegV family protein [Traorella sp.]